MSIVRAQVSIGADTSFPRDKLMINPHFENTAGPLTDDDWRDFAEDLATALDGYFSPSREVTVKIYDAQAASPSFPLGEHTIAANVTPVSSCPRELALCLSYFSGQNRPKFRGRLYVPCAALNFSGPGVRPSGSNQTEVGMLAPILADAGGADVDWVVWSRVDAQARSVSDWYVDDEWDIIRSRGMRPSNRQTGTVGE